MICISFRERKIAVESIKHTRLLRYYMIACVYVIGCVFQMDFGEFSLRLSRSVLNIWR